MTARIAMILPWAGALPWYYGLFTASVKNAGFDLIVIRQTPEYFRLRAEKALCVPVGLRSGYKLCDLKPMFGQIFAAELAGYDYWAFGDCDVICGRGLGEWIRKATDGGWDVATTRADWVTGSLTLMKNCEKVNALYRRSPGWAAVIADPKNHAFDEQGYMNWSTEVRFGVTTLERQRADYDSFGKILWNADDIRFLHEEVMCEDGFEGGGTVRMPADGALTFDGREIRALHLFAAKQLVSFRGPRLAAADVGAYTLTAGGYFPGDRTSRLVAAGRRIAGLAAFGLDWLKGRPAARQRVRRVLNRVVLRRTRWWEA